MFFWACRFHYNIVNNRYGVPYFSDRLPNCDIVRKSSGKTRAFCPLVLSLPGDGLRSNNPRVQLAVLTIV